MAAAEPEAPRPAPLRGARIEPSGYATILSAPPAPVPPPAPDPEPETVRIARERGISVAEAEARMNPDEATTTAAMELRQRLATEARGNFIDLRIVRDPEPRYVFQFRRDGTATLARFTSDPRFAATEGGVPHDELAPILHEWLDRFGRHRLTTSGSANPFDGTIEIHIGVGRSEYEAVAAREGWQLPPNVKLAFAPEIDPATVVATDVAPFVRAFARQDVAPAIILTSLAMGRVILHDGCFRLNTPDGPLILFGRNTRLHRDSAGYLTVSGIGEDGSARIGEEIAWGGYPGPVEDEPGVRLLREQCGAGPIRSIGVPTSAHVFRERWRRD